MMFANSRLAFLLIAVLFVGSHMAQANASREEDEGTSGMDTIIEPKSEEDSSADESGSDETGLHELPTKRSASETFLDRESSTLPASKRTSDRRKECLCWLGWRYRKNIKYINFGRVGLFRPSYGGQKRCHRACYDRCYPVLYYRKHYVCGLVKRYYNSRRYRGVGCFSQFGENDDNRHLWQFDNWSVDLCCKRVYRGYGCERGYYYHRYFRICLKRIHPECPQDMENNKPMTPECCINHVYSSCKWPNTRWSYRSVHCSRMRG